MKKKIKKKKMRKMINIHRNIIHKDPQILIETIIKNKSIKIKEVIHQMAAKLMIQMKIIKKITKMKMKMLTYL